MSNEELMRLLADLTGWGDQSLSVSISYKRAREWTSPDESELSNKDWGFVVSTTMCGSGMVVSAYGKTLPDALLSMASSIPEKLREQSENANISAKHTSTKLADFRRTRQ